MVTWSMPACVPTSGAACADRDVLLVVWCGRGCFCSLARAGADTFPPLTPFLARRANSLGKHPTSWEEVWVSGEHKQMETPPRRRAPPGWNCANGLYPSRRDLHSV
eukprot:5712182-Prymnesium_polylepis.1